MSFMKYLHWYMNHKHSNIIKNQAQCPKIDTKNLGLVIKDIFHRFDIGYWIILVEIGEVEGGRMRRERSNLGLLLLDTRCVHGVVICTFPRKYGSFCPQTLMGWCIFFLWMRHIKWYIPFKGLSMEMGYRNLQWAKKKYNDKNNIIKLV